MHATLFALFLQFKESEIRRSLKNGSNEEYDDRFFKFY
jgi:hypothetical protein